MADNVAITAGSGTSVATDDVSSVHYQKVKIDVGGDGVSAPLSTSNPIPVSDSGGSLTVDAPVGTPAFVRLSDGSAAITTLPVSLASVPSHAVTNAGTFASQENGAALTALQLIDDAVYTDDTSTHATGTSKGLLIMAAATPTDTAVNANDIGAVAMTLNREMLVSVNTALPAGTNAIGKLAANSGIDIGDVDITSVVPGTAATSLGKAIDSVAGATDTGVALLGIRDDVLTTLTPADGDWAPIRISSTGAVHVTGTFNATAATASTATLANVAASATSVTLQALNAARLRLDIVNDSTVNLYVKYGSTASTTSYTRLLMAGETMSESLYTGIVTGIWASATGSARMTELTA